MSAYDEFCGCGDYDCGQCFGGTPDATAPERITDNAYLDAAFHRAYPNATAEHKQAFAAFAKARPASPQHETERTR